jgi:hypothetical protein
MSCVVLTSGDLLEVRGSVGKLGALNGFWHLKR